MTRAGLGRRLGLGLVVLVGLGLGSGPSSPQDPPVASLPGQTATVLPDGRILLLGGVGPSGPVATAEVQDARTGTTLLLPSGLLAPRAWHTATVLPDGTVWVWGGLGAD